MAFPRLRSSNLIYIAICVACIAAFALVGIYPNARLMAQLDTDIEDLNAKVGVQEVLFPVLKELLKEIQQSVPEALLPIPEKGKMADNALGSINTVFRQIADINDVTFTKAIPDASSYMEDSGALTMNVSFSGDFFAFRNLLFSICRLPYLESIDQIRVETKENDKVIEMKLRLLQR